MGDTKYKKCFDCDFFENRCYVRPETVISICNKYHCCTSLESTCLTHKKHNHRNYDPELNASSAGRSHKTGATLSPLCQEDLINTTGPRHQMAKRDEKQEAATGDGAGGLLFSPPTLAKIHSSPTPDKEDEE